MYIGTQIHTYVVRVSDYEFQFIGSAENFDEIY